MPNVKGSVLRSRLDFVEQQFGKDGLFRLLERLPEPDRELLTKGLLPAQWYPFELGQRIDKVVMEVLAKGDRETFHQLGVRSADFNLKGVHQVFVHPGNPQSLLRRAPAIYKLYYDTGHRTYEETGESTCRLVTYDSESFSEADCLTVIGWHQRAVELCGGRNVAIDHPRCRAHGDTVCEYLISWQIAGG
jgi:uncharacterized protein (TIGR02265 family)